MSSSALNTEPVRTDISGMRLSMDFFDVIRINRRHTPKDALVDVIDRVNRNTLLTEERIAKYDWAYTELLDIIHTKVMSTRGTHLPTLPTDILRSIIGDEMFDRKIVSTNISTLDDKVSILRNCELVIDTAETILSLEEEADDHYDGYLSDKMAMLEACIYVFSDVKQYILDTTSMDYILEYERMHPCFIGDPESVEMGVSTLNPELAIAESSPDEYDITISQDTKVAYGSNYFQSVGMLHPSVKPEHVSHKGISLHLQPGDYPKECEYITKDRTNLNINRDFRYEDVSQELASEIIDKDYVRYGKIDEVRSALPPDYFVPVRKPEPDDIRKKGINYVRAWIALRGGYDLDMLERREDMYGVPYVAAFTGDKLLNQAHYITDGSKYTCGIDPDRVSSNDLRTNQPLNAFYRIPGPDGKGDRKKVEFKESYPDVREHEQVVPDVVSYYKETNKRLNFNDYSDWYVLENPKVYEAEEIQMSCNSLLIENAINAYSNVNNMLEKFKRKFNGYFTASKLKLNYRKYMEDETPVYVYDNYESFGEFREEYFVTDLTGLGGDICIKGRNNIPISPIPIDFKYCFADTEMLKLIEKDGVILDFTRPIDVELRNKLKDKYKNKLIKITKHDRSLITRLKQSSPLKAYYRDDRNNAFKYDLSLEETLALNELGGNYESYVVTIIDLDPLRKENSMWVEESDIVISRVRNTHGDRELILNRYPHPKSNLFKKLLNGGMVNISSNNLSLRYVCNKSLTDNPIYVNVLGQPVELYPEKDLSKPVDGVEIIHRNGDGYIPVNRFKDYEISNKIENIRTMIKLREDYTPKLIVDNVLDEMNSKLSSIEAELNYKAKDLDLKRRETNLGFDRRELKLEGDAVQIQRKQINVDNALADAMEREEIANKKARKLDKERKKLEIKVAKRSNKAYKVVQRDESAPKQQQVDYVKQASNGIGFVGNVVTVLDKGRKLIKGW